jgi:mRNA-degrading endonuclease RelE of RelBE toxin-antitoxin system
MANFRISDTFTDSLTKLTGGEQKAVKTAAFDLQMNPVSPGMRFHRLDKARDKNFWSVRVNGDIRLIVHRSEDSLLLCYVDHHDKAYDWAERRKLETHPKTGAAQLVEIRETVKEVVVPVFVQEEMPLPKTTEEKKRILFEDRTDDELLSYGVPPEWLADVRKATEDTLLAIADHLPSEASEALLELATGGKPRIPKPFLPEVSPFDHPDAQRRFRVLTNVEELQRALEFPWDKWTVFLHPEQKELVEGDQGGPARVAGSAGTGKTIVALHRAAHLARTNSDARVLLATFSDTLANALKTKLKRLLASEPRLAERIDIHSMDAIGVRLYKAKIGSVNVASRDDLFSAIKKASKEVTDHKFGAHFLVTEWEQIVDAWQLQTWDDYRHVARLGRKTRLPEARRRVLWDILERVRDELRSQKKITHAAMFTALADTLAKDKTPPFEFAVIDEAQDLTVAQLKFLAALGKDRPDALFFAGDLGQRIFQQPFSWKSLGVDVRGRSKTLRVNYRTSHQIRISADKLLGQEVTDVDGNVEDRSGTVSVFNGPSPSLRAAKDQNQECDTVAGWLRQKSSEGLAPHEFGVFVRSANEIPRAEAAIKAAGLSYRILDEHVETISGHVALSTMHLAKGLEFRAVVVMACDDEILPLQQRIETVGDDADLQEVYDTERQLLYVACTRARDNLLVTSVEPASEFLDDFKQA